MIRSFGVCGELIGIEVDDAQVSATVALGFVVEMWGGRVAAFAAGGYRDGTHARAELNNGDKAVAGRPVSSLGVRPRSGVE